MWVRNNKGNVFVGNLPPDFTDERLAEAFDPFGIVLSATVARDPATGARLRYGFVDIATERAAKAIAALDGSEIDGSQARCPDQRAAEQGRKPSRPVALSTATADGRRDAAATAAAQRPSHRRSRRPRPPRAAIFESPRRAADRSRSNAALCRAASSRGSAPRPRASPRARAAASRRGRCRGRPRRDRRRRTRPRARRSPKRTRRNRSPARTTSPARSRARADSRRARSASCGRSRETPNRNRSRGRKPLRTISSTCGMSSAGWKRGARRCPARNGRATGSARRRRASIVSNGCRPGWALANEACPGGCQSWVRITCVNSPASRLTAGTIASPSGTASAPPGQKSFCTSTMIRTSRSGRNRALEPSAHLPSPVMQMAKTTLRCQPPAGSPAF